MLSKVERLATVVAQALAVIGLIVLVAFAASTLADGILRRFAGRPIDVVRDTAGLAVAVAVSCCFPLALLQRANITIKFVQAAFGRGVGRYFDAAAAVVVLIVMVLIARQFFVYAGNLARSGDTTTMLEIRTAPFWFAVSIVLWISAAVQAVVVAREIAGCRDPAGAP
jgi:hypothetical protein